MGLAGTELSYIRDGPDDGPTVGQRGNNIQYPAMSGSILEMGRKNALWPQHSHSAMPRHYCDCCLTMEAIALLWYSYTAKSMNPEELAGCSAWGR